MIEYLNKKRISLENLLISVLLKIVTHITKKKYDLSERSVNYIKQTSMSFFFQGCAILITFIMVPLNLHYLGETKFGIWVTLFSFMSWISFFDLGLGNGMKNKVTEALARHDAIKARIYISTSYFVIGLFCMVLFILVFIMAHFISWQVVFNTHIVSNYELKWVFIITTFFVMSNFTLGLIVQVLHSCQKSSLGLMIQFFSNFTSLLLMLVLLQFTREDLILLALASGIAGLLLNLTFSYIFYKNNSALKPNYSFVNISEVKTLSNLGLKFFIMQVTAVVVFTTANIVIIQTLSPEYVTPFQIVFKYFSIFTLGISLLSTPLWPAYTDAYAKNDFVWIKKTFKKMNLLIIPTALVVLLMAFLSRPIIQLWVGSDYLISTSIIVACAIYVLQFFWNTNTSCLLNAIGKINLMFSFSIIIILLFIPLSVYLIKIYGVAGVVISMIVCLGFGSILQPIQVYLVIYKKYVIKNRLFKILIN